MKSRVKFIIILLLVILIPFGLQKLIQYKQLPESITIATGSVGGRYLEIAKALGERIEKRLGVSVKYVESTGSIENLKKTNSGEVQFSLFQSSTISGVNNYDNVRMISNVFPEVVIAHVRKGLGVDPFVNKIPNNNPLRVSMGEQGSGNAMTSETVINFYKGKSGNVKKTYLNYQATKENFKDGALDLALITTGKNANIQSDMVSSELTNLVGLPFLESFVEQNPEFDIYKIPAGFYGVSQEVYPSKDLFTLSANAQLICHKDVSPSMVTLVAEILMDSEFVSEQNLLDLRIKGNEYAQATSSINEHQGAVHYFDPELKPPLNPDFVEATEGMRSFLVSIIVALYFIVRWFKKNKQLKAGHHLDIYLKRLLDIEKEQIDLDEGGTNQNEIALLEDLLDEVTKLRQEALSEFSANDFNEDSGFECFLLMSNSLSDKINSKLTRQKICQQIELIAK
tara:strand:- start:449 stop:1810 length:1362 start_codon:yes stop_codon:yes gene_type:complete